MRHKLNINSNSPFRRRLQSDLVIRNSELELGSSLIHPLQAFPDGTHDRSMKPRLMPSKLLLARLSLTTRERITHCRHADETCFNISAMRITHAIQLNCRSFPSDSMFPCALLRSYVRSLEMLKSSLLENSSYPASS